MSDAAAMASSDEEGLPAGSTSGRQRVQRDYSDARLERVAAYTTTTMRLKPDKWTKMMACDDLRVSCHYKTGMKYREWRKNNTIIKLIKLLS